jgi:ribulose-phosphate 3-epimerase
MQIIPAILTDSIFNFQQQLEVLQSSSSVEAVHIDVIDGMFLDEITVTPLDLTVSDFEPLKIDFHFMTEEPMDFVLECSAIKEYLPIRNVIAQVERMSFQQDFIDEVKKNGWQPILALDLFTPLDAIEPEVWQQVHHIHLMSVEAGAQGRHFHPHVFEKIREIRQFYPESHSIEIMIDGGINLTNIQQLQQTGIDQFVVGSAIWEASDPLEMIEQFAEL